MELTGKTPGYPLALKNGPGERVASHPVQEDAIYGEGGEAMTRLNQYVSVL